MILFVELCVDLKKGKLAKDGLYQYKNTAQNTNVGTIEVRCSYCVHSLANPIGLFSLSSGGSLSLRNRRSQRRKQRLKKSQAALSPMLLA